MREVIARYGRLGGSQFAAAISYRALFSLVPLATFVATILAEVLSASDGNRQDVVSVITDQLRPHRRRRRPPRRADRRPCPRRGASRGLVALGLALWGATGVMSSILKTLAVVFDEGVARSFVRGRLVSALLVLGALGLVLCAVIVSMLENVVSRVSENVQEALGWQPFGFGVVLGVVVPLGADVRSSSCSSTATCRTTGPAGAPRSSGARPPRSASRRCRSVSAGTSSGPADFSKVYGSASAIFVFLFSVYLSASAFVICAILTAVLDERLPLRALAGRRLAGNPARVAGVAERDPDDLRLLVEDLERPLHRRRRQAADAGVIRVVEEPEQEQHRADHDGDPTHHRRLDEGPLAAVGEEQHEDEDDPGREEQHDPERHRDHALGAVRAVVAGRFAVGRLVEPFAVRRLLGSSLRLRPLWIALNIATPHGLIRFSESPERICGHSIVDDVARVTDERIRQRLAGGGGEELCRLELLGHDRRLVLGARARGVVALEGEEDDEPEHHGEPGRDHAEHAGRAVAVLEVAALGRASDARTASR